MKRSIRLLTVSLSLLLALVACSSTKQVSGQRETPDLVIYNAKVTTQNGEKEGSITAISIKDGLILRTGSDADILATKGKKTEVIDADGRRLVPGLNDNHIHSFVGGLSYVLNVQWDGVSTLQSALEMISEQAKRTPDGHWVKAIGGWTPHQFEEKRYPTIEELDNAVPNHPLLVQHAYNVGFVNSVGMQVLAQHAPFVFQIPQTRWEKNESGEYTGVVYTEPASWVFWVLESIVPQTTDEQAKLSLQYHFRDLNRMGITSVSDGGSFDPHPHQDRTRAVFDDSLSTVRVSFMEIPQFGLDASITALKETAPTKPGENMHPSMEHGYQFEAIGELIQVDLQNFNSISDFENFMQPIYHDDPDRIRKVVKEQVVQMVKAQLPFRIHATYNETITPTLDAIEEVNGEFPLNGLRWSLEHAETISLENIRRVKALGGAIAVQNRMALHGDDFLKTNGLEMTLNTPPMRTIINEGVPFSLGTDGLRASSFNPWTTMYWATTGKSVAGTMVLGENNRLTRQEALFYYTVGSAWHQYNEDNKGRIAPGQMADMALLNKDYFSVSDEEVLSIHSILTVMNGKVVYAEGDYAEWNPYLPKAEPEWSPLNFYRAYQ